jgi:hypothetical protein
MWAPSCRGLGATTPGSGIFLISLAGILGGIADLIDGRAPGFGRQSVDLATERVDGILLRADDPGKHDHDDDNDDRTDDVREHLHRPHGPRVGELVRARTPVRTIGPDLMLPDWCRLLERVDRVARCLERFRTMRCRDDRDHR